MSRIDKVRIEKNFSRHAAFYDKYADVQRLAAKKLMSFLPDTGIENILEIGCGTADYTILLKEKFKKARITAVDMSSGMIDVAGSKSAVGEVKFIVADAESLDLPGGFDLVTSNASFQWFEDIESSIIKYKKLMRERGVIAFSTFGPSTFRELGEAIREARVGKGTESYNFLSKDSLEALLKRCFKKTVVTELAVKEQYQSLMELVSKIKYTGAGGSGLGSALAWKRGALQKIEEAYRSIFGKIEATYQLFFCKGIK